MTIEGRNVQLVAGLHGNEKGPVRALRDGGYEFILGNPAAHERDVRFIDRDLNASFGVAADGYESGRAGDILQEIGENVLVIDFHTTSAITPPFAIVTDRAMLLFAKYAGLEHAVLMTHNIKKGHALINYRDGFSVEISGYDTPDSYAAAQAVLRNLESGTKRTPVLYEVYDLITEPGEYVNFTEHASGFTPIFVGEESYDFIGLKARLIT